MDTSSRHSGSNSRVSSTSASDGRSALRRDVTLAVLVCALLLLGVAAGGTVPARQEPLLVQPPASAAPAPALSGEFVYFPAQYVNQAVESAEDIPTF